MTEPGGGEERELPPAEVEQRLGRLPGWKLGLNGRWIAKSFDFHRPTEAASFALVVHGLTALETFFPTVELRRCRVRLKVPARWCDRVSDLTLEHARRFEALARSLDRAGRRSTRTTSTCGCAERWG
jgi:pterin-4a-carbinolamine dehydratase